MTKHFITSIPMQPKESLKACKYKYETPDGVHEHERSLSFPILVSLENNLKKGENFQITVILPDHVNTADNYERFITELKQVLDDKDIEFDTDKIFEIKTEYSESNSVHFKLFESIITDIKDEEKIYACITYGSKPMPMIMLMALNYIYRFCKNTFIESIVYGQFNHTTKESRFYDVSALFYMNSAVNNLALMELDNPLDFIKQIINE